MGGTCGMHDINYKFIQNFDRKFWKEEAFWTA
jgi:hypothetical protein